MSAIQTVKVKRDGPKGYHLINAADFDPKKHELFDAPVDHGDKPLDALPIAELKALASAKGLDFPGNVSKAKLVEMLAAS
ncbi:MAG TPA: hypothetical protein VNV16_01145 [Methylibium sp.]|nr:hypothetical protein [Methylibium sp.]